MSGERTSEGERNEAPDTSDCRGSEDRRASGIHEVSLRRRRASTSKKKGKWTVVEQFVENGFRYRVQRRPLQDETEPRLTKREAQVLDQASEGRSNKVIAHALGLAPSTVGVLLYRAAAKLGARSRAELLSTYAKLKTSRQPGP